ncbi:MAG: DNA primase [Phycisphaerae bacterium]|nr:DNA primase [Phycisphaerae bacterium]
MARFPEMFIQQVLQATDIVELVGQYVALKHKGREFVGLCPFHEDKNPSMYVSPGKQIYKCFACGAGGNAAQFLMGYEKLSFPEAIRRLAERVNIPLPKDYAPETVADGMSKNDLAAVTEFAGGYFQRQLREPAGRDALGYAHSRGLSDETIERFGVGYACDSWEAFLSAGRRKGFSEEQMVAAGLVRRREGKSGCYDYFRQRLMFPIRDVTGRVVAFGGRALAADERAKYLNSPEGALFDKSSLLYGLAEARESIVQRRQAVVVEGYLDVILPHQTGVTNVVATLGTALTEGHVRLLGRYAPEVVLVFDADQAGAAAAQRALELFLAQRMHVRVATIPAGKDPCDFSLAEGGEAFQALIDQAPDALQYVWDRQFAACLSAGGNLAERNRLMEEFLTLVVASGAYGAIDEIRRQSLAQHIAHLLNAPAAEVQQQMRRLGRKIRPDRSARPAADGRAAIGVTTNPERVVLEVLLDEPELFDQAAERIDPADFQDAMLQRLAERIWPLGTDGRLALEELLADEEMVGYAPTLTELSLAGQRRGNHHRTLQEAVDRILHRKETHSVQELKTGPLDDESLRELHARFQRSDPRKRPKIQ